MKDTLPKYSQDSWLQFDNPDQEESSDVNQEQQNGIAQEQIYR